MNGNHQMFRPPSEARSLILRVADGCPHNSCTFCGMYKGVPYRQHERDEILRNIKAGAASWPDAERIFLADGDVMALPFEDLRYILSELDKRFPQLARVNSYANGQSICEKTDEQLNQLRCLKLQTLYLGLESGDDTILSGVGKSDTSAVMTDGVRRASACGLRMSVMILIGLGGSQDSLTHAAATAEVVNAMQPRFLAALRYIPVPGTRLFTRIESGYFANITEHQATVEMREIISRLELTRTIFRANHVSNIVPLAGRFPKDKDRLLADLDRLLASGQLDEDTAGPAPYTL